MLFNLVGPLVTRNDFEPIQRVIEARGIDWHGSDITAQFEVEDRDVFNEDYGQPTSIDLVVENEPRPSLFIESKFVEREFGGFSFRQRRLWRPRPGRDGAGGRLEERPEATP